MAEKKNIGRRYEELSGVDFGMANTDNRACNCGLLPDLVHPRTPKARFNSCTVMEWTSSSVSLHRLSFVGA